MSGIIYLLSRSFKNGLLQMIKKPASLIAYLLFAGLMLFNVMNTVNSEPNEDPEIAFIIYLAIVLAMTIFTVITPIYQGSKRFTWNFLPGDATYLMAGPYDAKHLLMYAQFKHFVMFIWIALFMGIQVPIFSSLLLFDARDGVVYITSFAGMSIMATLLGLLAFVFCQKGQKQKVTTRVILVAIIILSIAVMTIGYFQGADLLESARLALTSDLWIFVPAVGWIMVLYGATTTGVYGFLFIVAWIFIIISSMISFMVGLKYADDTFYEDAMDNTMKVATIRKGIKEGKSAFKVSTSFKKSKVRKTKYSIKRQGVGALFDKKMLEANKKGIQLLDLKSIMYIVIIFGSLYFANTNIEVKPYGQLIGLVIILYILLIFQMGGQGIDDLEIHYIYMLPYNNLLKLLTVLSVDLLKVSVEAFLGFIVGSLVFGYPLLSGLLCGVVMILYNYCFSLNGIVGTLLFGKIGTAIIRNYLRVILNILVMLPGIIGFTAFMAVNEETMGASKAVPLALMLTIGIMLFLSFVLSIPSSLIVNKPEYNK